MKNQEKKGVSLSARILAGSLVGILVLGIVFTLIMALK